MEHREKGSGEIGSDKAGQEERDPFKQALRGHPEVRSYAKGRGTNGGRVRRPNETLESSCVDGALS